MKKSTEYNYNLLCNMQYYMEYCQTNGYVSPQDWLEKYKHYEDKKEDITYTEEEVKELIDLAWATASAYGELTDQADCDDWFSNNKKK